MFKISLGRDCCRTTKPAPDTLGQEWTFTSSSLRRERRCHRFLSETTVCDMFNFCSLEKHFRSKNAPSVIFVQWERSRAVRAVNFDNKRKPGEEIWVWASPRQTRCLLDKRFFKPSLVILGQPPSPRARRPKIEVAIWQMAESEIRVQPDRSRVWILGAWEISFTPISVIWLQ